MFLLYVLSFSKKGHYSRWDIIQEETFFEGIRYSFQLRKIEEIDYCVIFSNDRKKIKGRGRLTYRPDRSRSRSQTPPHWRAEKRKTISLDEYEKLKVEKAKKMDEIERRAEDRRRRHEVKVNDYKIFVNFFHILT